MDKIKSKPSELNLSKISVDEDALKRSKQFVFERALIKITPINL